LKRLRNEEDEELTNIISSHQQLESTQPDEDMPLLPDMEPFRLGRPLNVGERVNYIGGLSNGDPGPEYALFTSEEEESDSDD
jgi:hypothetical protein